MRRTTRRVIIRFAAYGLVLALLAIAASRIELHYTWRWDLFFDRWMHLLVKGLAMTLKVSVLAMFMALPMGVAIGLCRTSHDPGARLLGFVYVEVFRGTPLLVQVMIWYYFLADSLGLEQLGAAVVALGCFAGSYIAEIVRSGIQSIDRGQMEAARSLGLSHVQALRYIILPQALRRIMPPLASEFIALVKDSSLASTIGLLELAQQTRGVQSGAYMTFEPWLVAAILYLVINVILSLAVRGLERKLGVSQRGEGIR